MEEPGRLQSMGLQRVGHDCVTFHYNIQHSTLFSIYVYVCVKVKLLSRVRLFAIPWAVAYQAPLSMGFSRQ